MSYSSFLIAFGQMSSQKKARIVINNHLIFIEPLPQKDRWNLVTKVFHLDGDGSIPPSIQDCFHSINSLRWQSQGAYLQFDLPSQSLHFIQEVKMPVGKYIPFRHHMNAFIAAADEWRETLESFAERDRVYIRAL